MKDNPAITLLMATYNGGFYIQQQVDSILQQTYTNWKLLVRDDGSTDNTCELLTQYQDKYPDKIFVIEDNLKNLGSVKNFEQLLQHAEMGGYCMFSDQDDYWLPNKIEVTLAKMRQEEATAPFDTPILVFTNFSYADSNLKPIPEMQDFAAFTDTEVTLPRLLAQNPAYGCTIMMNAALAKRVQNIPPTAENHDYWIMLVCCLLGRIAYLNKKTIFYRQHGGNISGGYNDSSLLNRIKINLLQQGKIKLVRKRLNMLRALLVAFAPQMIPAQKTIITRFIRFAETKNPFLLLKNLKSGVRKNTFGQTFLLYLSMFLIKDETI